MSHYNEAYFKEYQSSIGDFGGIANLFKFEPFIRPSDSLLDYGCGGGYLLQNLRCHQKFGYDINTTALSNARRLGLSVYDDFSQIKNDLDIVISNHALEHVSNPFDEVVAVRKKLRPGGLCVFVVPYESKGQAWNPEDVNKHLYTWAPLNLGNLFQRAGFDILSCEPLYHTWPPNYLDLAQTQGWVEFHRQAVAYAHQSQTYQVRVVAQNPSR